MIRFVTALLAVGVGCTPPPPAEAPEPPLPQLSQGMAWAPPSWFPAPARDRLWVLDELDGDPRFDRGPRVRARGAILADLDNGEILWARDPDGLRPIASITKLVSSLALASVGNLPTRLDREVCISFEQWPSRPGARSKFETDDCHEGWELLGAALVASDNRGAYAFPRLTERDYFEFIGRMNEVGHDLGFDKATFEDPSGLEDGNLASPRDVLKAVTAVSLHPTLQIAATARSWLVEPSRGQRRVLSTNRFLRDDHGFDTLAAKTGYTDTAYYCLAAVFQSQASGRRYGAVVLASPKSRTRFQDVIALLSWAEDQT
ncbi:MAG: serine hydrolase [Myxococcota bacterium]